MNEGLLTFLSFITLLLCHISSRTSLGASSWYTLHARDDYDIQVDRARTANVIVIFSSSRHVIKVKWRMHATHQARPKCHMRACVLYVQGSLTVSRRTSTASLVLSSSVSYLAKIGAVRLRTPSMHGMQTAVTINFLLTAWQVCPLLAKADSASAYNVVRVYKCMCPPVCQDIYTNIKIYTN